LLTKESVSSGLDSRTHVVIGNSHGGEEHDATQCTTSH
jgi:hypothetical protein